jgi:hypothetical protein
MLVLSVALLGCNGDTDTAGTDNIPNIPLEQLTSEFENRFYQEVEADSRIVKDFDTKEQWVEYMSEIMDRSLAESYAEDYYYEEAGKLYLRSMGGPIILIPDKPYQLEKITDTKVQVTQINQTAMAGRYQLTVTYEYRDGRWIIKNQEFVVLGPNEESLSPEQAEQVISGRADKVLNLIANKDMEGLIEFVHPEKGVRFSPYSYVDVMDGVILMPADFEGFFSYPSEYYWGSYDGTGESISLTPADYYDRFIFDHDYRNADQVSYNQQLFQGNMINNAAEAYPGSIIVEYHFEGFEEKYAGMDWRSLRLVFEEYQDQWLLVGIIHDEWTI